MILELEAIVWHINKFQTAAKVYITGNEVMDLSTHSSLCLGCTGYSWGHSIQYCSCGGSLELCKRAPGSLFQN